MIKESFLSPIGGLFHFDVRQHRENIAKKDMKPLLRNLLIPATLFLGACCSEKNIVVAQVASPPSAASPASRPFPKQIVLPDRG